MKEIHHVTTPQARFREAIAEHNHKPDSLFPGVEAYRSTSPTGPRCLVVLAAMSACRYRRRLVPDAAKTPTKQLLTLEPRVSEAPKHQMDSSNLAACRRANDSMQLCGQVQWEWLRIPGEFVRDIQGLKDETWDLTTEDGRHADCQTA